MAFNPFAQFRKHQKYWMAGAVLTCMFTFVLCSGGMKGMGLDDLVLIWSRKRGADYVKVNGRGYNYEDISEIKNLRNIANDFMRETTKFGVIRLEEIVKRLKSEEKLDDQGKQNLEIYQLCLGDLYNKLVSEPRYFRGSTKLDDLIEFLLWRDLADRYNVQITEDMVVELVNRGVHAGVWRFDADASREIQFKVRATHYGATDGVIKKALRDEYRVQIVQLAAMAHWSSGEQFMRDHFVEKIGLYLNLPMKIRVVPTPEQISAHYRKVRTETTIEMLPVSLIKLADKVEVPWGKDPTKRIETLKDFYEKYASKPYNPNLETPGFLFPTRAEVQYLTADASMPYYKVAAEAVTKLEKRPPPIFSPLTPLASALTWVATGPAYEASLQRNLNNDKEVISYKDKLAKWHQGLMLYHQLANRDMPLDVDAAKKVEFIAAKGEAAKMYSRMLADKPSNKFGLSSWLTPYIWNDDTLAKAQSKPSPATAASLFLTALGAQGSLAAVPAFQAAAYVEQLKVLKPMVEVEKNKRIQVGAELFLAQSPDLFGGGPFTAAAMAYFAGMKEQSLPLAGYVEEDIRTKIEDNLAQKWVNKAMLDAKEQLETYKGREIPFKDQVQKLKSQFSREVDVVGKDGKVTKQMLSAFKFGETAELRNEYDIEIDEDLKPLREAFDKYRVQINFGEGRGGKPEFLKDGDFHKLFFGSDAIGVGGQEVFHPKVWPPAITPPKERQNPLLPEKALEQRLFDSATKPFLFWKSVKVGQATMPWDPTNARLLDFAEKQYRMDKARDKLLEEVSRVAKEIHKARWAEGKDPQALMRDLAKELGTEVVSLKEVAQLVENKNRGATEAVSYVEYALPRGKVPFARDDMVKNLLEMRSLAAPLKIEVAKVDELNKALFKADAKPNAASKLGQVQVLTNKPRTMYYVSLVTNFYDPSMFTYYREVLPNVLGADSSKNRFVDQVQQEYGKELLKLIVDHMRMQGDGVFVSDEAKRAFAEDSDQK